MIINSLDVRALLRNRFVISRPNSKSYVFKKRIVPNNMHIKYAQRIKDMESRNVYDS